MGTFHCTMLVIFLLGYASAMPPTFGVKGERERTGVGILAVIAWLLVWSLVGLLGWS